MLKKFLSLILLTVLVLTSFVIPAYADSAIGSEEIEDITQPTDTTMQLKESYTQEELNAILAHAYDINVPDGGLDFNNENFPLEESGDVSLMATTSTSTDYYIALTSDGKLVSSPNSNTVTKSSYSSSSSTNAMLQWTFEEISDNVYVIRKKNSPTTCIAAVPSSSSIITKTYAAGDTNCHWSIRVMSMGSVICSASSNSAANGKYFYYSGGKFVLSSSSYTEFGLIDVDWWVPATTITTPAQVVPLNGTAVITGITSSPSVANLVTDQWLNVTFANSSICSINGNWSLEGEGIGTTTATMTHKITGVSCTFDVYVGYRTNLIVYYDNAFAYRYPSNPLTTITEWFRDIRIAYGKLNIALIIVKIQSYRSYPETLVNRNMICAAGGTPGASCTCSDKCYNSSLNDVTELHHKNMYNILYHMPRPNINSNLNIFLTGHNVCQETSSNECTNGPLGLTLKDIGCAVISVDPNNSNGTNVGKIKKTIAHEIGHLFEVEDHYDTPSTNDDDCIWGDDRNDEDIYPNLIMCSTCLATLNAKKSIYNHS